MVLLSKAKHGSYNTERSKVLHGSAEQSEAWYYMVDALFTCCLKIPGFNDKLKMMKIITENRKAFRDFQVLEKIEGGLALKGQEVKSIKSGRISIRGAFIRISPEGEAYLTGSTVPPYQPKNTPSEYNPERERKILLKKSEIKYLIGKSKEKGLTIIPLKIYTKRGKIKIELGLAKGTKSFNKKEKIKKREIDREIRRTLKRGR